MIEESETPAQSPEEEAPPLVETVPAPKSEPKRRGRPPGAKNKPKPRPEPEPEPEPEEPRPEDVALATRYFTRQLGQLSQMSLEAKRERWRQLFM